MIPSRYYIVDERSSYPVKRRARGRRDEGGGEPAITLLPPDPYMIMEKPEFNRTPSPTMYRTAPPKSAKNKEASSFVILGETIRTPVQSRPGSPSGRVSPFRGRGFKSPATTRPSSRATSPSDSPKRALSTGRLEKVGKPGNRPRINRDIGLPPKSPKSTKPKPLSVKPSTAAATENKKDDEKKEKEKPEVDVIETEDKETVKKNDENLENEKEEMTDKETKKDSKINKEEKIRSEEQNEEEDEEVETKMESEEVENEDEDAEIEEITEVLKVKKTGNKNKSQDNEMKVKKERNVKEKFSEPLLPARTSTNHQRLSLQSREKDVKNKKPPVSPRTKTKTEKNETNVQQKQSVIKKTTKPPIPPKKIGLKTSLNETDVKKNTKEGVKSIDATAEDQLTGTDAKKPGVTKRPAPPPKKIEKIEPKKEKKEEENKKPNDTSVKISLGDTILEKKTSDKSEKKVSEDKIEDSSVKSSAVEDKKSGNGEKLIPCFQPDKCQIAPPTMASPSATITPTISTPSTSADLASSSIKNSQSIATAPTTLTPSSLSSVSSTVVLTGNLARKEIGNRGKSKETTVGSAAEPEPDKTDLVPVSENNGSAVDLDSGAKVATPMVKAATRDSIKWANKDSLSGEITSATKVIKAEPDMEVLSPNNLRDSPPRMPPPNLAWDEERLPNGDVPNRPENESKFRRFISAILRFFSYIFCCRCLKSCCKCCRERDGAPKPSMLSRLNCCKSSCCRSCNNPFKCCLSGCGCCKSKCCEGKKCCCGKSNSKSKSKSKKCCAKPSCRGCSDKIRTQCYNCRDKVNRICRSLFCLNMLCCQRLLKKCKCCHKLKCCQKNGLFSCCNPYVKKEPKKLHKYGSHASNHSRDKDQLEQVLVEHTSLMKAAIPVLPICLSIFCLICNLFVPGLGTFFSGILCLCFGKPRFSAKDSPKNRMGSFIVNTIIAVAQLFTIVFCLVGWGWSIWWGVIMYKLSRRQKRIKLAEKNQKEAEGSNVNHNHVDVEQG